MTSSAGQTWVLDCDGVVWLADEPIPGSSEAIARLRESGRRVVFLTNNSYPERRTHLEKLERFGIPTAPRDMITSPMAAASLVSPGERVMVLGGPGIFEALAGRGVESFEPGGQPSETSAEGEPAGGRRKVDAVVVGFDIKFDFARLAAAATAIRSGARLIATNDDATFPAPEGLWPGAGSFVAAVAKAGGAEPEVAGKPFDPVVALVKSDIGKVDVVVGDRPSTDGLFARRVGARFGLVLTGVTPPGHGPVDPTPDAEAADLSRLVEAMLADP